MMKYLIYVEGKADAVFIKDCLCLLNREINNYVKNKKKIKYEVGSLIILCETPQIAIRIMGGCDGLKKMETDLKTASRNNNEIIIIQDADTVQKNKKTGGIQKRNLFLNNLREKFKLEFKTFLFPNNTVDGDLETLLLQIVNKRKFKTAMSCYEKFIECNKGIGHIEHGEELMESKNKVYNYIRTYQGMEKANEPKRDYKNDYWDFDCEEIKPLLQFLTTNITSNVEKPMIATFENR